MPFKSYTFLLPHAPRRSMSPHSSAWAGDQLPGTGPTALSGLAAPLVSKRSQKLTAPSLWAAGQFSGPDPVSLFPSPEPVRGRWVTLPPGSVKMSIAVEEELTLATHAAMILKALQAVHTLSRWERAGVEGERGSPAPWRGEVWSRTMDGLLQDLQKRIAGEVRFDPSVVCCTAPMPVFTKSSPLA